MSQTLTGQVIRYEVEEIGSNLAAAAAAGDTTLILDTVVMFSPDGGALLIDGTEYDYATTDEDTIITLVDPLDVAYDADLPVRVMLGDGSTLTEHWATVLPDDPDAEAIAARIPTSMLGRISEGEVDPPVPVELAVAGDQYEVARRLDGVTQLDAALLVTDDDGNLAGGVNPYGDVPAHDLSYSGTFYASADTMLVDDVPLSEVLDAPRLIAWGERAPNVAGIVDSEYGVLSLDFYMPEDRLVTIAVVMAAITSPGSSRFDAVLHYDYNADTPPPPADNADTILRRWRRQTITGAGFPTDFDLAHQVELGAGYYTLRLTLVAAASGILVSTDGSFRMEIKDDGPPLTLENGAYAPTNPGALGPGGTNTGSTAPAQKKTYSKTYTATDTKWWTGGGTFGGDKDNQYFGNTSGTGEGNRKSVIWFPKSAIANDMGGATITKVELYLYLHNGGTGNHVAIGSHTDTSPGSNSFNDVAGVNKQRQVEDNWNEGSGRWVTINFANSDWATGSGVAGFVIGPSSNQTDAWAAGYKGVGVPNQPKLRITYQR